MYNSSTHYIYTSQDGIHVPDYTHTHTDYTHTHTALAAHGPPPAGSLKLAPDLGKSTIPDQLIWHHNGHVSSAMVRSDWPSVPARPWFQLAPAEASATSGRSGSSWLQPRPPRPRCVAYLCAASPPAATLRQPLHERSATHACTRHALMLRLPRRRPFLAQRKETTCR